MTTPLIAPVVPASEEAFERGPRPSHRTRRRSTFPPVQTVPPAAHSAMPPVEGAAHPPARSALWAKAAGL
ncbi:hypothetical protein [Microbacterium rhizophilus]|uniref:hypothetical protein n=1 Tax=Microbacterium rhizophilus TaxID=3138934 RepID=UPI0031E98F73